MLAPGTVALRPAKRTQFFARPSQAALHVPDKGDNAEQPRGQTVPCVSQFISPRSGDHECSRMLHECAPSNAHSARPGP